MILEYRNSLAIVQVNMKSSLALTPKHASEYIPRKTSPPFCSPKVDNFVLFVIKTNRSVTSVRQYITHFRLGIGEDDVLKFQIAVRYVVSMEEGHALNQLPPYPLNCPKTKRPTSEATS